MAQNSYKENIPGISIEEALQRFLAILYPNGIPEGEEGEKIIKVIKEKISKDCPEWAAVGERASDEKSGSSRPESYAEIKARIIEEAGKEDIPEDPEERYLFLRRKEATRNRMKKKEDEKENKIKEDLRNKLIAKTKRSNEETLKKALMIRNALEQRLKRTIKPRYEEADIKKDKKSEEGINFSSSQAAFSSNEDKSIRDEIETNNEVVFSDQETGLINKFSRFLANEYKSVRDEIETNNEVVFSGQETGLINKFSRFLANEYKSIRDEIETNNEVVFSGQETGLINKFSRFLANEYKSVRDEIETNNEVVFSGQETGLTNKFNRFPADIESLMIKEKKEKICEFNRLRKEMLKPREAYLRPRIPQKTTTPDTAFDIEKRDNEEDDGFSLSMENKLSKKDKGITLKL